MAFAVTVSFALSVLACVALACSRIFLTVSFRVPQQILTSGLEEEALFTIWRVAHGGSAYTDPFSIPFSASYFNWLFYSVYGTASSFTLGTLGLTDAWLPTITHTISLALAVLVIPLSILLTRELTDLPKRQSTWLGIAVGILVAHSPLVGWWALTTRPDIGALLLELSALALFLKFIRSERLAYLLTGVLVAYFAWSFRQVAVSVVSGLSLYLLFRRDWRALGTVVGLTFSLYGATLVFGGANYWSNTITCLGATDFYVSHGLNNLVDAAKKSPTLLVGFIAAGLVLTHRSRSTRIEPATGLLLAIWAFSFPWSLSTSMKVGASDNYYFPCVAFGIFLAVSMLRPSQEPVLGSPSSGASLSLVLLAQAIASSLVLTGAAGRIDLRPDQAPASALMQTLQDQRGPILVTERWFNLPWINPARPHFVYAYVYRAGPLKSHAYESGGIEGLVGRGYFKKIVVPKGFPTAFMAEISKSYSATSEDPLFTYYEPTK